MKIYPIELHQDLRQKFKMISILLQIFCIFAPINLIDLLVNRLYRLNELTQSSLKSHPSQKSQLRLRIALIPKMRKPLNGREDRFLLPLSRHLGDKPLIILIDLQREIHRTDEIPHRFLLNIRIQQIIPLVQRNSIVDRLLKFEGIIHLLLPRPHEINQPPQMPLAHRMLIESLRLHRSIPLNPTALDSLKLVLLKDPQ